LQARNQSCPVGICVVDGVLLSANSLSFREVVFDEILIDVTKPQMEVTKSEDVKGWHESCFQL